MIFNTCIDSWENDYNQTQKMYYDVMKSNSKSRLSALKV